MQMKFILGEYRYVGNLQFRLETDWLALPSQRESRIHSQSKITDAAKGLIAACLLFPLISSCLIGCIGLQEKQPVGFGVNAGTPCSYALSIAAKDLELLYAICNKEDIASISACTNANIKQNESGVEGCMLFSSDLFDFGVYVKVRKNVYVRKWIFNATFDRVRIMYNPPPKFEWITTADGKIATKPDMGKDATYIQAERRLSQKEREIVLSIFNPFENEAEERGAWEAGGGVVGTVVW
jgi:hypothetical protein